ncbi:MAG: efflux RND transporter permease subunit [Planctomycetes bacterium]|nr:efflux RND transporter permease subunit [Planctomycetota bacterium]
MNPVKFAIDRPVTVLVGVILVILFGTLAITTLPIQLTPNVDKPVVTVATFWEGASPNEVEREIVDEQEEKLKSIPGLIEMTSTAVEGSATIELEFGVAKDMSRALLDVNEKLRQVPSYPENVDEPVVSSGDTGAAAAIAWFILRRTKDSPVDPDAIIEWQTFLTEEVKPRLERAEGIATVGIIGGVDREVHIDVDPSALAARKLSLGDVRDAIRRRNVDVSAGDIELGKRTNKIRTVGKFESLAEIEGLLVSQRDGQPVYLRDVATVKFGYKESKRTVRSLGQPAIAVNASRETGTNIITVMSALQAAVTDVNDDLLRPEGLELVQVYDQTDYIYSAIDLVLQNLWVGGALAILVLLLFLRQIRSTLVVGLAIPISTIGAFLGLVALGRNLNVISLAGLAFAVGMVVDNSIVVLENIYRHRQMGKTAFAAAYDGTSEVWGAVVASTLTTLAVFIPVVFVQEEAGQLFADIAIAISAAVFMSLIVSVLFIPMLSARLVAETSHKGILGNMFGLVPLAEKFTNGVTKTVLWINASLWRGLATVVVIVGLAVGISWFLAPRMNYLPNGNQNLVFGFMIAPPGSSRGEFDRIAHQIETTLAPYWGVEKSADLPLELRKPAWYQGPGEIPGLENFFFVALESTAFLGARSLDENNVAPIASLLTQAAQSIPGIMLFASQRSLFERGVGGGSTIDLEISGYDLEANKNAALALMGPIAGRLGFPRPEPSNFALGAPELQIRVDEARAAELGVTSSELGFVVRTMVDGSKVDEFRDRGVTLDVKLRPNGGPRGATALEELPIWTPVGRQVALGSVASLSVTTSPTEIRHIEEDRAIRLKVTPPPGMDLATAMDVLDNEIVKPARGSGAIPKSVRTGLSGTADKLVKTREALGGNFLLALVITYLLLASLFESFLFPFVIMLSVPLAAVGGIAGLRLVGMFSDQQLDVLTMLGFVILIGTVVNNAILIVHQALQNVAADPDSGIDAAIGDSVRTRIRPIFMSTLTSVLGMLPLVLFPGAGSELYRGLGSVVVGGLLASTIFTLFVVPALFRITWVAKSKVLARAR